MNRNLLTQRPEAPVGLRAHGAKPGIDSADAVYLYLRYVGVSLRGQMQYRFSFLLTTAGLFLGTTVEFLGIVFLFQRFGSVLGWRLPEVALLYGIVNVAYAIAEGGARGFDTFPALVKSGDFDRLLLRPRSTALQVAGRELQIMRIGRLAQGAAVLLWAAATLDVRWTAPKIALLAAAISGGASLFFGLFVVQATIAFWTIESLEIMNALTYGGTETAQYPLSIYRPWFRRFFTFVVPIACVNFLPAKILIGAPDRGIADWLAPLVGFAFLAVCLQFWRVGVRHYRSTGS